MRIKFRRDRIEKEIGVSWLEHMKFQLFGEFRIFYWFFAVAAVLAIGSVLLWVAGIATAAHFIMKYW